MRRNGFVGAVALVGVGLALAPPAWAGGVRSFVSGGGVDTGTCERVAPCRTFGYAITQTTTGGEVVAVDSSGYGPVTIDKEITLVAPRGVHAAISPSSGNAVTVAAGTSQDVVLRNLVLRGNGGPIGVDQVSGRVAIEDCSISRFVEGVRTAAGTEPLTIVDSRISRNTTGVSVTGGTPSGIRPVVVAGTQFRGNVIEGLFVLRNVDAAVSGSLFANNATGLGVSVTGSPAGTSFVSVAESRFSANTSVAIGTVVTDAGNAATIEVGRSLIVNNLQAFVGNVFTYGDNAVRNNANPSSPAGTVTRT